MSAKPYIVMGEAQESDSEEEINSSGMTTGVIEHCKGKIVIGEAPESDEECSAKTSSMESISSAASALSAPIHERKKTSKKHESVLVKKLYERNASLYKNLTEFVEQTATNAGNELNTVNKKLLQCQLQVQEGADYLKTLNCNLNAIDTQLQMLLSADYLPNIKVEKSVKQDLKS